MAPIIRSLLDTDFYKLTMGQLIWKLHPDVPTVFRLTNRHAKRVRLADYVLESELRAELEHVRTLRFTDDELAYLAGIKNGDAPMFSDGYLAFLRTLHLPPFELSVRDGQFELSFSGKWSEATYWEIPALAIVNELYCQSLVKDMSPRERAELYLEGARRRDDKISLLQKHPEVTFVDFGTRRRFSSAWQDEHVVAPFVHAFSPRQFLGTSNVFLARKYGIQPMGTVAHEAEMGYFGIFYELGVFASQQRMLRDWWSVYGYGLSVALTDTYGTDAFFRSFTAEQAREWKGLRQDSGDPIAFGEAAIRFYESHGIDPREKLIVFSDGLIVTAMLKIADHFKGRIKTAFIRIFGWGTNLTNDLGIPALSIVVKLVEANGHGTVKLSDNLAKAIGSAEEIERVKNEVGYTATLYETPTY